MTGKVQLGYVFLFVQDISATIAFYEKAFGLEKQFVAESNLYAELKTGETTLAFVQEDFIKETHAFHPNRPSSKGAGAEIAFIVEDVEQAFQRALKAGAQTVEKPHEKPWGQTVSSVRDHNGFFVEICSRIKSEK